MKVSTRGRYALRLMLDLALNNTGEPVRLKDVAKRQEIHNTLWHHNFPCGLSKPKKEACLFFQTRFFFLYAFLYSLLLCILFTELPQMPHPDPR